MKKMFSILLLLLLSIANASARAVFRADDRTVEQLKAEAEHSDGQQGRLYAEIAEKLVAVADKHFTDAESVKGHATVKEILDYAIKARDAVVKTRKKMKETEIHLRECRRRLEAMRRTLAAEDRPSVEAVEKQLEELGSEILNAMFSPAKGHK
jgi:chromosome segregation ATPase